MRISLIAGRANFTFPRGISVFVASAMARAFEAAPIRAAMTCAFKPAKLRLPLPAATGATS
jgi:hypothetical protein